MQELPPSFEPTHAADHTRLVVRGRRRLTLAEGVLAMLGWAAGLTGLAVASATAAEWGDLSLIAAVFEAKPGAALVFFGGLVAAAGIGAAVGLSELWSGHRDATTRLDLRAHGFAIAGGAEVLWHELVDVDQAEREPLGWCVTWRTRDGGTGQLSAHGHTHGDRLALLSLVRGAMVDARGGDRAGIEAQAAELASEAARDR